MFAQNPFKVSLISNKIPEGGKTTVYKCGPLIDLCMGPHVPHTGRIKAFAATKYSGTNWLGQVTNDPLQRIYGIAFPDKAMLKQWQEFQEKAKQRYIINYYYYYYYYYYYHIMITTIITIITIILDIVLSLLFSILL
jgi:threonyl-tRNA synthetase